MAIDATKPFNVAKNFTRLHYSVDKIDLKKWITEDQLKRYVRCRGITQRPCQKYGRLDWKHREGGAMTILEMLTRNARMCPERVALIERVPSRNFRVQITWKEFDQRVNRIANALSKRGVTKGDMVVHWMMNSITWLEAYFGIIRTGAVAVPLNFRFNEKDFKYCVEVAEPKIAIIDAEFADRVRASRSQPFLGNGFLVNGRQVPDDMEDLETVITQSPSDPFNVEIEPEDPCGLDFTSGTTGSPNRYFFSTRIWSAWPSTRLSVAFEGPAISGLP